MHPLHSTSSDIPADMAARSCRNNLWVQCPHHCSPCRRPLPTLAGLYPAAGDLVNVPEVCINAARQEILDQWCDTNIIPAAGDPVGSGICRQCTVCPTGQYPTTPCRTANAVFTVDGFADTICGPW